MGETTTREVPMTAEERAVLEWMADRWRTARAASKVAEQLDRPLPKVQAALVRLRARRFAAYFEGHPGTWAVTSAGRAEVDAEVPRDPIERYRMALEMIAQHGGALWCDGNATASIARLALGSARHG